jgi:CarD family transcriptional regulator
MTEKQKFNIGDKVVYPSHGVGEVKDIEVQVIAEMSIEVYVISFSHNKMTLRVPVARASSTGLRGLSSKEEIDSVYQILNDKPKKGNKMWSRRAQEYESKINSGQLSAIAEVVRDLYRNVENDRSYSERTIYESALYRIASEMAALENVPTSEISEKLVELLKEKLVLA